MKKIYYLGSCDKCRKILRVLEQNDITLERQDIKIQAISEDQLSEMKKLAGSYEKLFSKSARKYKTLENKDQLTEKDYRNLILSEYTYLKRPVILDQERIFIGVSPNNMDDVKEYFSE
ncbi:arsenate reductase (glutaredoxin) [Flavobacteriaceae bacterium UJ101]|nr:arsenate reductase (glutaredoxin) [Flavobacteriaceae bacterium UJ101]